MSQGFPAEEIGYIADKRLRAENLIQTNEWDIDAWNTLVRVSQQKNIEVSREFYERLVTQFPNAGRYWKIYIDQELRFKNFERVEKLFQRCLMKILHIDLWKTYLNYIKEAKGALPSFREKMAQAFDFALDKIGLDVHAFSVWADYITFLKSVEAVGSYAENQRITAVRKVYQRAIMNPMVQIETIWKDYNVYEQGINPLIAKKMQEDRGRDYLNAKRVTKEYEVHTKGLSRNAVSVPPLNTPDEVKQVELWKKYIHWEKSNPLRTEDQTLITRRVMYAYEQCLLCLGCHPEMWIEAASFLQDSCKVLTDKGDQTAAKQCAVDAAAMYERAVTTMMPKSQLLYFAYADYEESRSKYDKVHSIYKRLIDISDLDPTLAYIQYMNYARRAEGIKSARSVFKIAREDKRCQYHIYQSAALLEYYCSKDAIVAIKIFELGLKKYGGVSAFLTQYLMFMAQLNEDNNTRVLYERLLTSDVLNTKESLPLWNMFLEFENKVGDLASIFKVEKRRQQAFSQEYEGKEAALIIDRYRYGDLYPSNFVELRSMGYKDAFEFTTTASASKLLRNGPVPATSVSNGGDCRSFSQPNTSQMLPFKPCINAPRASLCVEGGLFAIPREAEDLLKQMPPPTCFLGPFVKVDQFIDHMKSINIDEGLMVDDSDFQLDKGTQFSLDVASGRKRKGDNITESDEEDANVPPNDIYRSRQLKKLR